MRHQSRQNHPFVRWTFLKNKYYIMRTHYFCKTWDNLLRLTLKHLHSPDILIVRSPRCGQQYYFRGYLSKYFGPIIIIIIILFNDPDWARYVHKSGLAQLCRLLASPRIDRYSPSSSAFSPVSVTCTYQTEIVPTPTSSTEKWLDFPYINYLKLFPS